MIRSLLQFSCIIALIAFGITPVTAQNAFEQVELTDAQVSNFIKANSDLHDVLEKIEEAGDKPDEKLIGKLESIAKKHNFKSFEELDIVAQTISFIMTGFNQEDGTFTEPREAMEKEIAILKKDTSISKEERQELLEELEEAVKIAPNVKFKSNIDLVKKYLDKLENMK